jgi:Carboxypeptidase regulatory-like domain/TonB-dependent Receptor Plug Domain/TonB dependent receptor
MNDRGLVFCELGRAFRFGQRVFHLLALLVVLVAVSSGQTAGTGAISGTITDPKGAVVAMATISAIDVTTGEKRTTVSSTAGTYLVPLLLPATYRLEVSKEGFKLSVSTSVPVHVTETVTVNVRLAVGAARETVTVTGNSELLKTEDSTLGHVVDGKEVSDLPLVTRNYAQILGLSPGVSAEVFNAGEIGRGGVDDPVVIGGGSYEDNNFQMNGVEINDMQGSGHFSGGIATPNPDSIQEFKVQTGQYDASYGRDAGANVDVLTKTGSNAWHGNMWEYFRNEDLNANSYFQNETGEPRGVLRENQFGFTLGGQVKKDKLLFFTSYQGTRQENGIDLSCSSSAIMPVLSGSDRSAAALAASVGPATAFGGVDPLGRPVTAANVSPQALALFSAKLPNGQFVIPNPQTVITDPTTGLPEGFSTYSSSCPYREDQFITNLDWLLNAKSSFQGRFFFANSQATFTLPSIFSFSGSLPGSPTANPQNFRNFSLTYTYLFTTHLVNQAEIGFHRTYAGTQQSFPLSYSDIDSSVPSFDNARPVIAVFGGLSVGGNGQSVILGQNTYVFQDTLSWVHGRHSFRFGGGLTRAQDNLSSFQYGGYSVFLDYPGLLLGLPPYDPFETIDLAGITPRNWRVWDGNLYAQDDVKLTPRLTVNLGFRYERLGDFGEINGRNASMNPALINTNPPPSGSLAGIVVSDNFPGTIPAGVTTSGNNMGINGTGQNTLNPRIGFAWSLPGSDSVVLRGGYGVYHQRATGQPYLQQLSNQPFGLIREVAPDLTNGFADPFPPDPGTFPQFFPYSPVTSSSPGTSLSPIIIDLNLRPPVFQRYSLNVQTQISRDFVLEIGYAGMRGTHMLVLRDINEAPLATPENPIRGQTTTTLANIPLRVPYEGFAAGSMYDIQSNGFAWYNALQASLSKRFSHGLQFLASYTWSSDLANVYGSTNQPNGGVAYGDNNNPRADYGPDVFVRPQRFVLSAVYELPGPSNRHSLRGETLGNWKLAGVGTFQSGHRLPLLNNDTTNAYGIVMDFAEIVPGCQVATSGSTMHRLNNWINQNCIAPYPVVGSDGSTGFGNSRMGILGGPSQINTDLSLIKLFPLGSRERANLEFRAEFFNAFNHPIFSDPDNTVSDGPSFGHITTTASNPRVIQFALKVNF